MMTQTDEADQYRGPAKANKIPQIFPNFVCK